MQFMKDSLSATSKPRPYAIVFWLHITVTQTGLKAGKYSNNLYASIKHTLTANLVQFKQFFLSNELITILFFKLSITITSLQNVQHCTVHTTYNTPV